MKDESKKLNKRKVAKVYQRSEHGKLISKKRYVNRMGSDMWFVLKKRISRRVRSMVVDIAKNNCGKRLRTMELLGCSIEFFKTYFENKFIDGMCWERISEIHIDHIKPCIKFDLSDIEQQKLCFHYSNLQPLWQVDNLIKGCKYEESG